MALIAGPNRKPRVLAGLSHEGDLYMEMEEQERMPQRPTNNLFLAAGSFGIIAFLFGFGLLGAIGLGLLH
jgi:hypothetical protein